MFLFEVDGAESRAALQRPEEVYNRGVGGQQQALRNLQARITEPQSRQGDKRQDYHTEQV